MSDEPRVIITERFTRTSWHRKIGDGPWEEMDCSPYGGKPPVVFLGPRRIIDEGKEA